MILTNDNISSSYVFNSDVLLLDNCTVLTYIVQVYPMAVVGTAGRGVIIYQLDNQPQEFKRMESPLKYQVNALVITLWSVNHMVALQSVCSVHMHRK